MFNYYNIWNWIQSKTVCISQESMCIFQSPASALKESEVSIRLLLQKEKVILENQDLSLNEISPKKEEQLMKRFVDPLFEPYSVPYILARKGSIVVKCPKCQSAAYIGADSNRENIELFCHSCFYRKLAEPDYTYSAAAICTACECWFNEPVKDERQFTQKHVHIICPACHTDNIVELHKRESSVWTGSDIRNGRDPFFDQELYFLDYYRGKMVWAVNREHLTYLIDYIAASLRERPNSSHVRTASYRLPKYMKEAKNRNDLIRLLQRMQRKK